MKLDKIKFSRKRTMGGEMHKLYEKLDNKFAVNTFTITILSTDNNENFELLKKITNNYAKNVSSTDYKSSIPVSSKNFCRLKRIAPKIPKISNYFFIIIRSQRLCTILDYF